MLNSKRSFQMFESKRSSKLLQVQQSSQASRISKISVPMNDMASTGTEFSKSINRATPLIIQPSSRPPLSYQTGSPQNEQEFVGVAFQQQLSPAVPNYEARNTSPPQELSSVAIRGTFQREHISHDEKLRLTEQKRQMREELDRQIQEKKMKLLREKELEKERQKQEEERIKKEIQDELAIQEKQRAKEKQYRPPENFVGSRQTIPIPHQGITNPTSPIYQSPNPQSPQPQSPVVDHRIDKPLSPEEQLQQLNSAQGFYMHADYIEFLKQQNENLRAENEKKDGIIKGLMVKTNQHPARSSVKSMNPTPMMRSNLKPTIQPAQLAKSQSSKQLRPLPRSQQEKKQHVQRLPQITTPQPQLSHLKHPLQKQEEETEMFPAPSTRPKQLGIISDSMENEHFQSRKKLIIKEEDSNWSFGNALQSVLRVDQELAPPPNIKQMSQFGKKRLPHRTQESHDLLLPAKLTTNMDDITPKRNLILPRPPILQMQEPPFLRSEYNHINPEFTFSSSVAERFKESKRTKDKLPKEFQVVPTKRKFFV